MNQIITLCLLVLIMPCLAAQATVTSPLIGGNAEGVNATVFGIYSVPPELQGMLPPLCVDAAIDTDTGVKSDRMYNYVPFSYFVKADVKIVDTDDAFHDNSDTINLGRGRYIFVFYSPDSIKMKHLRFEVSKYDENNSTGARQIWKEQTPFIIKVNETPDNLIPSKSGNQVLDGGTAYKTLRELYLLNATSNSTIENISITPENIYLMAGEYGISVGWYLNMKLENVGSNPQSIRSEDFKFEDQYDWKYRPKGFASYTKNSQDIPGSQENEYSTGSKITLLPGEVLKMGMVFEGISELSKPIALEYRNQSLRIDNVTSETRIFNFGD